MTINKIIQGDTLEKLKELPDESVDCVITSPPYYGLRDYLGIELNPEYIKIANKRIQEIPERLF